MNLREAITRYVAKDMSNKDQYFRTNLQEEIKEMRMLLNKYTRITAELEKYGHRASAASMKWVMGNAKKNAEYVEMAIKDLGK